LPASLVIIKGTQRYASDGKVRSGYTEYDKGECLQMIGRAGRPQFESTSATAVIMTKQEHVSRYQGLASGRQAIESTLHRSIAEFLNAEVAMRIVTSRVQAQLWLRSTFLWVRLFRNPAAYGLPHGVNPHVLATLAMKEFVDGPLLELEANGLLTLSKLDGTIMPTEPGRLMCKHCIRLQTMSLIRHVGENIGGTSMRDLLEVSPPLGTSPVLIVLISEHSC
jgi:replicative superfamily II helicase